MKTAIAIILVALALAGCSSSELTGGDSPTNGANYIEGWLQENMQKKADASSELSATVGSAECIEVDSRNFKCIVPISGYDEISGTVEEYEFSINVACQPDGNRCMWEMVG
jgi:hypothetical protein